MLTPAPLDDHTIALFIEVPVSKVVLFQAYFDIYEGVATVRTLNPAESLICILTTPDMLNWCQRVLVALQPTLEWRTCSKDAELIKTTYFSATN